MKLYFVLVGLRLILSFIFSDKTGLAASLLLEQGANPNAIELCSSRTPLHVAVLRNNSAVARAILAQDHLDVNQKVKQLYLLIVFKHPVSHLNTVFEFDSFLNGKRI